MSDENLINTEETITRVDNFDLEEAVKEAILYNSTLPLSIFKRAFNSEEYTGDEKLFTFWSWFHVQAETFKLASGEEELGYFLAAAVNGCYGVLEFLLQNCPKELLSGVLNKTTEQGNNALHLAAMYGHQSVVALLCDYAKNNDDEELFDINKKNNEGDTAAHLAAKNQKPKALGVLKDHGADLTLKNNETKKPTDFQTVAFEEKVALKVRITVPTALHSSKQIIDEDKEKDAAALIKNAYKAAASHATLYHGALQRCVRRLKKQIFILEEELKKPQGIFMESTKRNKIRYMNELMAEFDMASKQEKPLSPVDVIEQYKKKLPEKDHHDQTSYADRYKSITVGFFSKRSSELLTALVGAISSHDYLIERSSARIVCTDLLDSFKKGVGFDNQIKALTYLRDQLTDRTQFNKSIKDLIGEFQNNKLYDKLVSNDKGLALINHLNTLDSRCVGNVRESMDLLRIK